MGEEKEKDKEVSTDMMEKPETTKFGEFCQRHGINSNLIMLKITLFVMYGGKSFIYFSTGTLTVISVHFQIKSGQKTLFLQMYSIHN